MNNVLIAIEALEALTTLAAHVATEIAAAGDAIRTAQSEGRDLTDEEAARFTHARRAAVDAWDAGEPGA